MITITQDDTPLLLQRLTQLQQVPKRGQLLTREIADRFLYYYKQELGNQTNLSEYTKELYQKQGDPDSTVRESLKINYEQRGSRFIATVGFDDPKSGMISNVQEYGTVITVTEKMRAYLASAGMPLRDETTHIEIPGKHAFRKAIARAKADYKILIKNLKG